MYVSRKYGILHVSPAPERSVLACYRSEGGITIEKFREQNGLNTFGLEKKMVSQVVVNEMVEEEDVEDLLISSKKLDDRYQIEIATDRGDEPVVIIGNNIQTGGGKKTKMSVNKRPRPTTPSTSSSPTSSLTLCISNVDSEGLPIVSMDTEIAGADTLRASVN